MGPEFPYFLWCISTAPRTTCRFPKIRCWWSHPWRPAPQRWPVSPSLAIHHAVVSIRVLFAGSPSGHCLDGGLWSEPPQEWARPKTPRINSHREEVCGVSFYTFPFRTAPPSFATAGVGWGAFLLTHHTLWEPLTHLSSGVLPTLLRTLWVPFSSCPAAARPIRMCLVQL